jgi:peptide/nickel transport system permease protein
VRAVTLSTRENQYVEAARLLGARDLRVLLRHVLPNILYMLIISAPLRIGGYILLAESSLSFLGFGVKPPHPTWGQMLSGAARNFMVYRPEMALFPGLALTLVVFGFKMCWTMPSVM